MSRLVIFCGKMLDPTTGECIGVKRVGKDTCADILEQRLYMQYQFERHAIAAPIKEIVRDLYVLGPHDVSDAAKEVRNDQLNGWTPRRVYEVFGTEFRKALGLSNTFWIQKVVQSIRADTKRTAYAAAADDTENERKCADSSSGSALPLGGGSMDALVRYMYDLSENEYKLPASEVIPRLRTSRAMLVKRVTDTSRSMLPPIPPRLQRTKLPKLHVITDCRFYSEYKYLRSELMDLKPIVVRIERNADVGTSHATAACHASNQVDDRMIADVVLHNNGTREELQKAIEEHLVPLLYRDPRRA